MCTSKYQNKQKFSWNWTFKKCSGAGQHTLLPKQRAVTSVPFSPSSYSSSPSSSSPAKLCVQLCSFSLWPVPLGLHYPCLHRDDKHQVNSTHFSSLPDCRNQQASSFFVVGVRSTGSIKVGAELPPEIPRFRVQIFSFQDLDFSFFVGCDTKTCRYLLSLDVDNDS